MQTLMLALTPNELLPFPLPRCSSHASYLNLVLQTPYSKVLTGGYHAKGLKSTYPEYFIITGRRKSPSPDCKNPSRKP